MRVAPFVPWSPGKGSKMRVRLCTIVWLLFFAGPASAVSIDWVPVANPTNAPDTLTNCLGPSCGSVSYSYYIDKYEVTNAQYVEFLTAKAVSDPLGLYNPNMNTHYAGGITQSGSSGSYTYALKPGMNDRPVTFVSFWDAARFTNWLNNGQGSGDTETGAYTLSGGTPTPSNLLVARNSGAITFLPSENEWYKAAYYDAVSSSYFDFPTGTNTPTPCASPSATPNQANCQSGYVSDVGSYTGSASPYGTFDQGGNVWEWNEQLFNGNNRGRRGGGWPAGSGNLAATAAGYEVSNWEYDIGFRVASVVPEPGSFLLVCTGLLGLGIHERRLRR